MLKKISTFFYNKSILNYVIIFVIAVIASFMYVLDNLQYSIQTFITMTFILFIGMLFCVVIRIVVCFSVLKLLKLNVKIKNVHNQIIPLITLRFVVGAFVYVLAHKYTTISVIINSIIDIGLIVLLCYIVKRHYNMNFKQTIFFGIINLVISQLYL